MPATKATGSRTVLSPIGLNVRAHPQKDASLVGSAAQGVVLTVTGYTSAAGGWYEIKGTSVTGWVTADPTLSAAGEFRPYNGTAFNALVPATWTSNEEPPATVAFAAPSGGDNVIATTAANVTSLPAVPVGYGETSSEQVVVCGVTTRMLTFSRVGSTPSTSAATSTTVATGTPQASLVQVKIPVDAQHALGFYANLADLNVSLPNFKAIIYSVTFASPVCSG